MRLSWLLFAPAALLGAGMASGQSMADIRANGATSSRQIAAALNDREVPAPRGGAWSGTQVLRLLQRASA